MNLLQALERRISAALVAAGGAPGAPALVGPATRPEFGDYQANGCMAAAKALKTNPRKLAETVVEKLDLADLAESVEIAGPGFLNIRLRSDFLAGRLAEIYADPDRLAVAAPEAGRRTVVDYSGPNLAKEMHVGHLRSTIIGDALARVLGALGAEVIRQNHVGDWGTQFGMLIAYMQIQAAEEGREELRGELADLEAFYRNAKKRFDEDPDFADLARRRVVELQSGDEACLRAWRTFIDESLRHCREVYARLGVSLGDDDLMPESAYNERLPGVIETLREKGLLTESQGALCVFLEEFKGKDGEPLPVIVQKTGGGYLYATTDLAAVEYRSRELRADRVLYVTDSRQALHFQQVFAVARAAGMAADATVLEHVPFGTMMGEDRKPFKTRTGGTVKLMDLLDEAEQRARRLIDEKSSDIDPAGRDRIAAAVGIGAVKYADLAHNRTSDYVFSWEKLLSLEGNTAPYMQYAYARVRSLFRRGGLEPPVEAAITLEQPAERVLALKLARFAETLHAVAEQSLPHLLCGYLYELAVAFTGFYENCPVLKADGPLRESRLALSELTARTIRRGLELLGIETIEQM
jgi:arginyl-tRNA synthetase